MKCRFFLSVLILSLAVSCGPKDGMHTFYLCTTNDVHGRYFDSLYVGTDTKGSLLAVSRVVDSIRTACGDENVVLVDAGDCVQGDNASYYFNFVDTLSPHLYAEMANYMRYDAHVLGNHDIETGHPVYDRLRKQLKAPMLAANALRTDNGKAYFDEYAVISRHGVRIAVIGFTNANIKNWLSPELWSGMEFERILLMAQETVDRVIEKERPHVVIVAVHSGTGEGNGNSIENEGLDLFRALEGVDFVVCAHDHRPAVFETDSICMINSGSHCRNIGFGRIDIETKDGKVISKALSASLIPVDKEKTDITNLAFSSFTAERNIHPTFIFDHHLTRLRFDLYPGSEEAKDVYVDSIKVYSKTKGVFTVAHKSVQRIGIDFSADTEYIPLALTEEDGSKLKEDTYHTSYEGDFDGPVYDRDKTTVGGSILAAPDSRYEVHLYFKRPTRTGHIDTYEHVFTITAPGGSFSPGMQYTVRIAVYELQSIDPTVSVEEWEYGGDAVFDEDEMWPDPQELRGNGRNGNDNI